MTPDGDAGLPGSLAKVLADVAAERAAQDARWGMQVLPDGTGGDGTAADSDLARHETDTVARSGALTWRHILAEEVLEAFAETDRDRLRAELIQVAAVAVKWAQALDRRPDPASVPDPALVPDPAAAPTAAAPAGQVRRAHPAVPSPPRRDRFRAIVAVHVLLVRDGAVLLGRRAGTGYGDGLWHLPAGHLEAGEAATGAAIREAAEELGVAISAADLTLAHVMHHAPERLGLFFTAGKWTGEPRNTEPHKCSELAWWPMDDLPPDMIEYAAAAIADIRGGLPFSLREWGLR
ncbi:NUDIX hydrolase [Nonomuraea sp. H19]|uniref:NUDIX hydrolase n=1 Tax=Nonomuraea sp. H19 TaxID=3452206 RepID=UPI003F88F6C8